MLYMIIRNKYRKHEITAAQVWEYADEGKITAAQALLICGPRPAAESEEGGEGEAGSHE